MMSHTDDPTIAPDDPLWRRIPPTWVVFDENLGRKRPTSAAFDNARNGSAMSVVLGRTVQESGRTPESALASHRDFLLASITAGLARQLGQIVARDPLPDEPAHAVVAGPKTGRVRTTFARQAIWILPPPP